jgi:hypothetical protein
MGPNAEDLGMLDSRPMHRSPVTKEDLISDPVHPIEAIKKTS